MLLPAQIGAAIELRFQRSGPDVEFVGARNFGRTILPREYVPDDDASARRLLRVAFFIQVQARDQQRPTVYITPDPTGVRGEGMVGRGGRALAPVDTSGYESAFSVLLPTSVVGAAVSLHSRAYNEKYNGPPGAAIPGGPFVVPSLPRQSVRQMGGH